MTSRRKSRRASLPRPDGGFPPTVAVTCGRARPLAAPARPACARRRRRPRGAGRRPGAGTRPRRPAQGVEDLARVDHGPEPRAGLGRPLHGQEEREQPVLLRRAGVLAQRLAEREVLGLAVGGEARGVGREEGEGRLVVLAVLGEVEVDAADQVPGRVPPPRGTPACRGANAPAPRGRRPPSPPTARRGRSAVRYSAPVMGGAAAARARSSSRGGGGGAARPAAPSPSGVVHSAVTKSDPSSRQ